MLSPSFSESDPKQPLGNVRYSAVSRHLVNAFVILKPMLFELSLEKFRTALLCVMVSLLP